ncbi:MAG: hypothetical protein PHP29_10330, partial [Tissierellia bacterium]|nr:hypothetical protein [Tissierellia bacterium]
LKYYKGQDKARQYRLKKNSRTTSGSKSTGGFLKTQWMLWSQGFRNYINWQRMRNPKIIYKSKYNL